MIIIVSILVCLCCAVCIPGVIVGYYCSRSKAKSRPTAPAARNTLGVYEVSFLSGRNPIPPVGPSDFPPVGPSDFPPVGPSDFPPVGPSDFPPVGPSDFPPVGPSDFPPIGPSVHNQIPPVRPSPIPPVEMVRLPEGIGETQFHQPYTSRSNAPPSYDESVRMPYDPSMLQVGCMTF